MFIRDLKVVLVRVDVARRGRIEKAVPDDQFGLRCVFGHLQRGADPLLNGVRNMLLNPCEKF